jgi:hypothetical protein
MVTFSSLLDWITTPACYFLELTLLFISYKRKLYRLLVFFSVYIVLLNLYDALNEWVSFLPLFTTVAWNYVHWSVQFVFALLRLLTIAEISRRSLRGYPAVWAFAWRILSAAAMFLLSWAAYSAIQNVHHFRRILAVTGERFEFMQSILVILLLLLGAYYHVRIPPLFRWMLIGIGIYSAVQVTNDQFLLLRTPVADSIFVHLRHDIYPVPLAIWTYAAWRWGADSSTSPDRIPQSQYDDLSPQIYDRLEDLNDTLKRLGKR